MTTATLVVTETAPLKFTDVVRAIHDCPPENTSCTTLYYIATAFGVGLDIGVDDAWLFSRRIPWPTCLLCNRCLVEPETWKFPLAPMPQLVCAQCMNAHADPPVNYHGHGTEENYRKHWLISNLDNRPFPGDAPAKRAYSGSGNLFADVKEAYSVEEIAGRFTDLVPAGRGRMKGPCPLHADGKERTASFYVFTEKQTWRCFGACATGGDVIRLTQELMDKGVLV